MATKHLIKARGLPWSASASEVCEFFDQCQIVGGDEGVRFVQTYDGRPSGTCYVEVESQEDVDAALAKDKEKMGKRYIEVFQASEREMEADCDKVKQGGMAGGADEDGVVKLRGLPFSATKADVVEFFSGLDIEENGILMLNDFQGRPKGECFVQFTTTQVSSKALERNKANMGHRYIEVFPSSMDEARMAQTQMAFGGPRGGSRPGGPIRGGMSMRPSPYDRMGYGAVMSAGRGGYGGGPMRGGYGGYGGYGGMGMGGRGRGGDNGTVIKMRGLPFRVTEQEIAEWFSSVADPIDIYIKYNAEGRPSGDAEVTFNSESDAKRAMQKDKQNMQHRYIELFLER